MIEEIRFYHLTKHRREDALKKLLPLAQSRYGNIVLYCANDELSQWDKKLWDTGALFLPHNSQQKIPANIENYPARQPIYLCDDGSNPNQSDCLFCLAPLPNKEILEQFKLICLVFSAQDSDALNHAREAWQYCKTENYPSVYYSQNEQGGWQAKENKTQTETQTEPS